MDEYEIKAREVALAGLNAAAEFLKQGGVKPDQFGRAHKRAQVGVSVGQAYVRYLSAKNNQRLLDLNEEKIRHDLVANHGVPAALPARVDVAA